MGLESATYISGLNASNPTSSDNASQGDDHIRLIKSTLLSTFPNVTGAVTPTHTELNYVDGVTSAIQTQLDAKLPMTGGTMTGIITFSDDAEGITYSRGSYVRDANSTIHVYNLGSGITSMDWYFNLSGPKMSLASDGKLTATDFTISSDARLKENVLPIDNAWSVINGLHGYRFNFINDGRKSLGFVAQDVEQVLPELVTKSNDGFLSVSYQQIVAVLVEAIKDLRAEVDALKGGQNDVANICAN